jgi:hypothetical protein
MRHAAGLLVVVMLGACGASDGDSLAADARPSEADAGAADAGASAAPLFSGAGLVLLLASDGHSVFWVADINGVGTDHLMKLTAGDSTMLSAIDGDPSAMLLGDDDVYLALRGSPNTADGQIVRISKGGSPPLSLIGGQRQPLDLAWQGTTLYWANGGLAGTPQPSGQLMRSASLGSAPPEVVLDVVVPSSIAVDQSHVLWTERVLDSNSLSLVGSDGTGIEHLDDRSVRRVSSHDGVVYGINGTELLRITTVPFASTVLYTGRPVVFTVGSDAAYLASLNDSGTVTDIVRVPLDGSPSTTIVSLPDADVTAIAVDEELVYWAVEEANGLDSKIFARPR